MLRIGVVIYYIAISVNTMPYIFEGCC